MKKAIQFGAGNIGRGFMGQLFWEADYEITFVEYSKELVNLLNSAGEYPLRLLDAYSGNEIDITIDHFSVLHTSETERIATAFAEADIIGTAVGVRALDNIAKVIAEGISKRIASDNGPVDIYLCENIFGAGAALKQSVFSQLGSKQEWAENNVGFVSTSVARMVPAPDKRFEKEGSLFVVADSYHNLPYDGPAQRSDTPSIEGMKATPNFKAEVERKLYTHNLGHAAMGYIGYLKGYTYVDEPFNDKYLSSIFNGALEETAEALVQKYPDAIDAQEHEEIIRDVNIRFGNPMLHDAISRVARDPMRKLGFSDRLIGSARLCLEYGIEPKNIAIVCGAAFCYDHPEDDKAVELQSIISKKGIEYALHEVSGVDPSSDLGKSICLAYKELSVKRIEWLNNQ